MLEDRLEPTDAAFPEPTTAGRTLVGPEVAAAGAAALVAGAAQDSAIETATAAASSVVGATVGIVGGDRSTFVFATTLIVETVAARTSSPSL